MYIGKLPLKKNKKFSTAILLTGVAVFFYATQALAASGEKSAKDDPLNWVPPTHVQMLPMMVPAGNTTVAVTFVLEAIKRKRTEGICKRMPIVRDAILRTLSREPIPVKRRRLVTDGIDNLILDPINRAIKRNYVKKIYVMPGAIKMGEAKVKHKAYAVIDGCLNILRSEKARAQALKAAQEK